MFFWINIFKAGAIPKPALHKNKKRNVNKGHIKNRYTHISEKTFCRHPLQGSMTVEASIVIPMVFFVWMACVSWTSVVKVHETIQHELVETAMELSAALGHGSENAANLGSLYAWGHTLMLEDLTGIGIDSVSGFQFLESQIMDENDGVLLKVTYRVKLFKGIIPIPSLKLTNQVYTRAWTGGTSKLQSESVLESDRTSVYVAEHGHVYHTDPLCSHIHLTIFMVDEGQTSGYEPCEKCMNDGLTHGTTYYITEDGECYHSQLGCSGLKRNVSSVYLTEAGTMGYAPCSRCGGG